MTEPYIPIACADYDFLEIACMDGLELGIETVQQTIRGKAITTEKNALGEFLVIENADGSRESIRADKIVKLTALDQHARFSEHSFNMK